MNEGFDINKKIDQKEYRKDLADKLKEKINETGFEAGREYIENEKANKAGKYGYYSDIEPKSTYEKAKELKLVEWLLEKHPGDYEKIENQIKELGFSKKVSDRINEYFKNQILENTPNLEKMQSNNCDLVLQPGKDNKFILLDIVRPRIDKEEFIDYYFSSNENYEKRRNRFIENKKSNVDYNLNNVIMLAQEKVASIVIARPYKMMTYYGLNNKDVYTVSQHHQIMDEFVENRDIEPVPVSENQVIKEASDLILRKNEILVTNDFLKKITKIIEEETDCNKAKERIEELQFPLFQEGISEVSGGYIEINDDGTIIIYGKSDKYGMSDKEKVAGILKNDFPDKNFEVN